MNRALSTPSEVPQIRPPSLGWLLHGFRVPFEKLVQRSLTSLDYLVKIVYRSHLEITSIAGTFSFPKTTTHL